MKFSQTLFILCKIVMCYSLIKPGVSTVYKRMIPERKNITFQPPMQIPKIVVEKSFIPKNINHNDKNSSNDNTTSVRININPDPLEPDSSLRAHMIAMLFI